MARTNKENISNKNEALTNDVTFAMNNCKSNKNQTKSGRNKGKFVNSLRSVATFLVLILVFAFAISTIQGLIPTNSNANTLEVAYANGPGFWSAPSDLGTPYTLSEVSDEDITNGKNGLPYGVYQGTESAFNDSGRQYFSLGSDAKKKPSLDDLKYNSDNSGSIGFNDYKAENLRTNSSDYSFVWWIDIIFEGDMLQAVRNGNVSLSFSTNSYFSDGEDDQNAPAMQWIVGSRSNINSDPIDSSRSGDDAYWTSSFKNSCFYAADFKNGDGSWSTSSDVNSNAIGVRLVFGAISDYALDGGFYNINLTFSFKTDGIAIYANNSSLGRLTSGNWGDVIKFSNNTLTSTAQANSGYYIDESTSKNSYSIKGWKLVDFNSAPTSTYNQSAGTSSITISKGNIKPYSYVEVIFTEIEYTVEYNNNGKDGAKLFDSGDNEIAFGGVSVSGTTYLSLGYASYDGYTFDGWLVNHTSIDSGNPDYREDSHFYPYKVNPNNHTKSQTVILYAYWKSVQAGNGGENDGITKITKVNGEYSMYSDVEFQIETSKVGYELIGVYAKYTDGDIAGVSVDLEKLSNGNWKLYALCGNCNLYPRWKAKQYSIKYFVGESEITPGESVSNWTIPSTMPTSAYLGQTINFNSYVAEYNGTPVKTFLGWTTSKDGDTYLTQKEITSDLDVYIRYEDNLSLYNSNGWTTDGDIALSNSSHTEEGTFWGWGHDEKLNKKTKTSTAYKQIKFSDIGNLSSYNKPGNDKTVTISIGYKLYGRSYNSLWDNSFKEEFKASLNSYDGKSFDQSKTDYFGSDSSSGKGSDAVTKTGTFNLTRTYSYSETGFTIFMQSALYDNSSVWYNYKYVIITSLTYTVKTNGCSTIYTVSLVDNSENDFDTQSIKAYRSGDSYKLPDSVWNFSKKGYYLSGWKYAGKEYNPGDTIVVNSDITFEAMWSAKNYPLIGYDVYTDGTNYATEIHKVSYYVYGQNITLNENGENSANTLSRLDGNNNYTGFTANGKYTIGKYTSGTLLWNYSAGSSYSSSFTCKELGGYHVYYQWSMNNHTVIVSDADALYGNSIILDDYVSISHEADGIREINYVWDRWQWISSGQAQYKDFYLDNENVIYLVSESGSYTISISANLSIKNVDGSTSILVRKISDTGEFTIAPISVKLNNVANETFYYNGSVQKPLYDIIANDVIITDTTDLANADATITVERSGKPWFYDANGKSEWNYGIDVSIVALNYKCSVGQDINGYNYSNGRIGYESTAPFRDAGTYTPSDIRLLQKIQSNSTTIRNTNYRWYDTNEQFYSKADETESLPSSTIYPYSGVNGEGVVLYFTPSYKMFGVIDDPSLIVQEGSYLLLNQGNAEYEFGNSTFAVHPYICVDGLVEGDFEYFETIFKYLWTRDEGNKAGLYNVRADFSSSSFNSSNLEILYRLYNNYGIQLDTSRNIVINGNEIWSGDDVGQGEFVSRTGGIGVYYVGVSNWYNLFNSDGSLNGWTVELEDYSLSKSHSIFKIQARTIDIVGKPETDSASFVYDGKGHGFDLTFAGFSTTQDIVDLSFKASLLGIRISDLPANWDSLTDNAKAQWLRDNADKAIAVGVNGGDNKLYYDEQNNINYNTLSFAEINAGSYGIVLCGFDGGNYELNIDGKPFYEYRWEIERLTVTFVHTSVGSNTLGDAMYGGYSFSFNGLLSGDGIKIATDIATPLSCGFRFTGILSGNSQSKSSYSALSDISEHLSNNYIENNTTLALFAKYAGNYSVTFTLTGDNSAKEHSGKYGDAYTTNYKFSSEYEMKWTVNTRELSGPQYTSTVTDWIYEYNVSKGKTVSYSGFWSIDFKDNDIAPTVLTDVVENKQISVKYELNGSVSDGVNISSDGIGGFSVTFKGINQGTYSPIVNSISSGDIQTWTIKQSSASTADDGQFVILPKTVLLVWLLDDNKDNSIIYDALSHEVTADFYGIDGSSTSDNKIYSGDSATIKLSGDVSQTNAGTYRAVASLSSANYTLNPYSEGSLGTSEFSWEIRRRNLTVVYPDVVAPYTYDGDSKSALIAVSNFPSGGAIDELNSLNTLYDTAATITSSSAGIKLEAKNAATYTVKAKSSDTHDVGTNYTITISEDELNEKTIFIIEPRVVKIDWNYEGFKYNGDMLEIEYDATPKSLTASISNKVNNDDVELTYKFDQIIDGDADRIKVGTYRTTIDGLKGASRGNYTLDGTTDTEREWSIVKRVLTVVWYPYADNYYNSQSATVNGFFTVKGGEPEAGSGKITDPYVYYYNGNNPIGVYCVVSGLVGSDSITVTLNGSGEFYYIYDGNRVSMPDSGWSISSSNQSDYRFASTSTAVNDTIYTVSFSANNDNYDISYRHADGSQDIESASYKITKRELRIAAWDMDDDVDNSFAKVYDGVLSTVTATLDGVIPDSDISLSYSDNFKTDVGKYIAKIVGILGADRDNYSLPTDTHKLQQSFAITSRTVEIQWSFVDGGDFTKVYRGSNYTLEAKLSNIVNGDSVEVSRYRTDYRDGTNLNSLPSAMRVGEYTTYALELNNDNYSLPADNSQEWEITPFELTVTWTMSDGNGSFAKIYDGKESVITATVNKIGSDDILLIYNTVGGIDPISGTAFSSDNRGVNVNTYITSITLDGTNKSDYVLPNENSVQWSITPRTVELSWNLDDSNEFELVYDGNNHSIGCDIANRCSSDDVSVELAGDLNKCIVGNYTAKAVGLKGTHSGNYTLDGLTDLNGILKRSWSITPRTLGVSFDGVGGVYKKDDYTITVTVINIVNSDYADNLAVSVTNLSDKSVANIGIGSCVDGIYTATVTSRNVGLYGIEVNINGDRSDCYTLPDTQWTWEITALGIDVSWSLTAPAGGSVTGFVGTYAKDSYKMEPSLNSVLGDDTVKLTLSGNTAVVTGNYTATVDAVDNPNYTITNGKSQNWEIIPKKITKIYWSGENSSESDFSWVYDGTAKAPTAHAYTIKTSEGNVDDGKVYEGDTVSFTYSYSGDRIVKGNYTATVTELIDNVNYILGSGVENATQEMEITPRTLSAVWLGNGGVYNKQYYVFTLSISNLIPSDYENELIKFTHQSVDGKLSVIEGDKTLSGNSVMWSFSAIDAGSYAVSVDILGERSSCYTFATTTKEFDIEKSEIGVEWDMSDDTDGSFTKIYDGNTSQITAIPTGVYAGDIVNIVLSGDVSGINASDYFARVETLDGKNADNYKLPNNISRSWQIEKLAVCLDWKLNAPNNGNVDGFTGVYAKNDYTLSATVTNRIGEDSVTVNSYLTTGTGYNSSTNTALNEGTYTTRAVTLDNDNYTLVGAEQLECSWLITPKTVTEIYWTGENSSESDFSWIYDGTVKAPKAHAVSIGVDDGQYNDGKIYIGDNVSFEYSNSGESVVGTHSLSVTAVVGNSNYVLGESVGNGNKEYYITAKTLDATWTGTAGTYNGTDYLFVLTVSGILSEDYDTNIRLSMSTNATKYSASFDSGVYTQSFSGKNAGDYLVSVTLDGSRAHCYAFSNGTQSISKNWTIAKKSLTVEFTVSGEGLVNGSVIYDAQNHGYSFALVGLVDGESLNVNYNESVNGTKTAKQVSSFGVDSTVSFVAKDVADYSIDDITVSSASGDVNNYSFTPRSTSWKITPRAVELNWSMDSFINYYYRASDYKPVATVTNPQGDDSVIVNGYSTSGNKYSYGVSGVDGVGNIAKNVDNYRTKALSLDNNNYTLDGATNIELSWSILPKTIAFEWIGDSGSKTDFSWDYDGTAKSVSTEVQYVSVSSGNDTDGKVYEGDSVTIVLSNETNILAGSYLATATGTDNTNYIIDDNLSRAYSIEKRKVTLVWSLDSGSNDYSGTKYGYTLTATGFVPSDYSSNITFTIDAPNAIIGTPSFTDSYSIYLSGIKAGDYSASVRLSGARADCYYIDGDVSRNWNINKKEITATIGKNIFDYKADRIENNELNISFSGLVSNESLGLDTDYTLTFDKDPIYADNYVVTLDILSTAVTSNYKLVGQSSFDVTITKHSIDMSDLLWSLNGTEVDLDNLVFATGEYKSFTVSITDSVFNKISGKQFTIRYFGFCTCGSSAESSTWEGLNIEHQWFDVNGEWQNIGPEHAGSYWAVVSFDSTNADDRDSFVFENFDNYTNSAYFTVEGDNTYLRWNNGDKVSDTPLPTLGDNVAAVAFGIQRAENGATFAQTPKNLPFSGSYYTVDNGLPFVTAIGEGADMHVTVNGKDYSYADYTNAQLVRNAGKYSIRIYDQNATTSTIIGCDLFNTDATLESDVILTIDKQIVTINNTATKAWSKVYDRKAEYLDFSYESGVTFSSSDNEGVISSAVDGVIEGTSLTISAVFDSFDAGSRILTFTLDGADKDNYTLKFSINGEPFTAYSEINGTFVIAQGTAEENTANGDGGYITKKEISAVGLAEKEFDGTDEVKNFTWNTSDIISGDTVSVSGHYTQVVVGDNIDIVLSSGNDNYIITSSLATGKILPKQLTVSYFSDDSVIYDGNPHGVDIIVDGMIDGFIETVTVSGDCSGTLIGNVKDTFTVINAGDYTISLSLPNNTNYYISNNSVSWHITKRTLGITWSTDNLANEENDIYSWITTGDMWTVKFSNKQRSIFATFTNVVEGESLTADLKDNAAVSVGSYTATVIGISGDTASNYTLPTDTTKAWAILKAEVKSDITGIILEDKTVTYNSVKQTISVNKTTTQHGISVNVSYTGGEYGSNGATNVGEYKVTATIAESESYYEWKMTATLTIVKAKIEGIGMDSLSLTYDGKDHCLSVDKLTTQYGETVKVTYKIIKDSTAVDKATNVGKYEVTATLTAGSNYNNATLKNTLEITHAEIKLSWTNTSNFTGIYSASSQGVLLSVIGIVEGDKNGELILKFTHNTLSTYTIGKDNAVYDFCAKDAGVYAITVSLSGDTKDNYIITNTSAGFTINKKTVTISGWNYQNNGISGEYTDTALVYNKSEYILTPTIGGIIGSDKVNADISGNKGTNAYTYHATVSLSHSNYTMDTVNKEWIISPKPLSVTWDYTDAFVYDATSYEVNAVLDGIYSDDKVNVSYKDLDNDVNKAINAGTYSAKIESIDNTNYILPTEGLECDWSIEKADIEGVILNSAVFEYDGNIHYVTVNKTTTQHGIDITVSYVGGEDGANGATNVGKYTVIATISAGDNYNDKVLPSCTLEITPVLLSLNWSYSDNYTGIYSATDQGVLLSVGGIVENDLNGELKLVFTHNTLSELSECESNGTYKFLAKNAGTYSVSVTLDGDHKNNYKLPDNSSVSFTIKRKVLTITKWMLDESDYTAPVVYNKKERVLCAYTDDTTYEGDTVNFNYNENAKINVEKYTADVTISGNDNYELSGETTKTWEILPKQLTIVWSTDIDKTYNHSEQSVTATLDGRIKGDTVNIIYDTTSNRAYQATDAGNYTAEISSIDNKNYSLPSSGLSQDWSIKQAKITTITFTDAKHTYDGSIKSLAVKGDKTQYGENVTVEYSNNSKTDAGEYMVTATVDGGKNYEILTLTAVLTIDKAKLEITVNGDNIVYDGEDHTLVPTFALGEDYPKYTLSGDTLKVVLSATHNDGNGDNFSISTTMNSSTDIKAKNAGTYNFAFTVTPSETVNADNYVEVSTLVAVLVIEKADMLDSDLTRLEQGKNIFFCDDTVDYLEEYIGIKISRNKDDSVCVNADELLKELSVYTSKNIMDTATISYSYSYTAHQKSRIKRASANVDGVINAGVYTITANIVNDNYNTLTLSATLTVNRVERTVNWVGTSQEYTYSRLDQSTAISASFASVKGETKLMTVTVRGVDSENNTVSEFINAGTYTFTASYNGWDSDNYIFSDNVKNDIKMKKYTYNASLNDVSMTYDGNTYYLLLNAGKSTVNNETVTVLGESERVYYTYKLGENVLTTNAIRNVGVYTVVAHCNAVDDADYNPNIESFVSREATFTVNKKDIAVEIECPQKVYDGSANIEGNVTVSGIVESDVGHISTSVAYSDKNVATTKRIIVTLTSNDENFPITNYNVPTNLNGTINARTLDVDSRSLQSWQKDYDGTIQSAKSPITLFADGFEPIDGDDITIKAYYNSKNVLEANSIVFNFDGKDANNYRLEPIEFNEVDHKTVFLINALNVGIEWSGVDFVNKGDYYSLTYDGYSHEATALIRLKGDDITTANNGTLNLTVSSYYVKKADGTSLSAPSVAELRNAGTYNAVASIPTEMDDNMRANYGITTTARNYIIEQASVAVQWNLADVYTYNGANQSGAVSPTASLLGEDRSTYTDFIVVDYNGKVFKDAGTYDVKAVFNSNELTNNYKLINDEKTIKIEKANVTNLSFLESVEWTYDTGETKYFFVTANGAGYSEEYSPVYYEFDPELEIRVNYSGGEFGYGDVGRCGIKNAGTYTITASVSNTSNYNDWSSSVTVTVNKGTINNVYIGERAYEFDGNKHYIYASNKEGGAEAFENVVLPDGTNVSVNYRTLSTSYFNSAFYDGDTIKDSYICDEAINYAEHAGLYQVGATITDQANYNDWSSEVSLTITQKTSAISWYYNGLIDAKYVYNATDQSDSVTASIVGQGISGNDKNIYLSVAFKLGGDVNGFEELSNRFVLAGDYTLTASFAHDQEWEANDYKLNDSDITRRATIQKFVVELKWYFGCCEHSGEEYSEGNVCVYNKREHIIIARGLGLGGVEMELETSGDFKGINADKYTATVSKVKDGTDNVVVDGVSYEIPYNLNYETPTDVDEEWTIAKRPITIDLDIVESYVSKKYDGSKLFTFANPRIDKSTSDGIVFKTYTYTLTNKNYDGIENRVVYKIGNIVEGDGDVLDLYIESITANETSTNATGVHIIFKELTFNHVTTVDDVTENYWFKGDTSGLAMEGKEGKPIIQPLRLSASISSNAGHVYNGLTFDKTFVYADGCSRTEKLYCVSVKTFETKLELTTLIDGNCYVGNINIGGGKDKGSYTVNANIEIVDGNGVHNYVFVDSNGNIIDSGSEFNIDCTNKYSITKRKLALIYDNLLQSYREPENVTAIVDLENCELTDLEWGIAEYDELNADAKHNALIERLKSILVENGMADNGDSGWTSNIEINNRWNNSDYLGTLAAYTSIIMNQNMIGDDLLLSFGNLSNNFVVPTNPTLKLTYIRYNKTDNVFDVYDATDIQNLANDATNLQKAGIIPEYRQHNDISMVINGSLSIIKRQSSFVFSGIYDGGGYTISDLMILSTTDGGLFGQLDGATVKRLNIERVNAITKTDKGGIIASKTVNSTIENVTVSGIYTVNSSDRDIKVGFVVGETSNTKINGVVAVGYLNVYSKDATVGGIVGEYNGNNDDAENNVSFVDTKVVLSGSNYNVGPLYGTNDGTFGGTYLNNSVAVYLSNGDTRFVNGTDDTGLDYDGFKESTDDYVIKAYNLVKGELMRNFALLPNASDNLTIGNYRQLALLSAYGWLDATLISDIYIPYETTTAYMLIDSYYGNFTANGKQISSMRPTTYRLFILQSSNDYIIVHSEKTQTDN